MIEDVILKNGLCLGCGLCSAACEQEAISMSWSQRAGMHVPVIDAARCSNCGKCLQVCPNSPETIVRYAAAAAAAGENFGLADTECFVGYDSDEAMRLASPSGGLLAAVLKGLLDKGEIDGVIAARACDGKAGEQHFTVDILRTAEQIDGSRCSAYQVLCYKDVLDMLRSASGRFAVVALPCIIRGLKKMPPAITDKIRYTFALACSHNVSACFIDVMAKKFGISGGESFTVNCRDKQGSRDASNYNTLFTLPDRQIRHNRFDSHWTSMWRNYFFAMEACLYCGDFFGVDADISCKDAWGARADDPAGTSYLIVRNRQLPGALRKLTSEKKIHIESCGIDEVFASQRNTTQFKHVDVAVRIRSKEVFADAASRIGGLPHAQAIPQADEIRKTYFRLLKVIHLSRLFHRMGRVPVRTIVAMSEGRLAAYIIDRMKPILDPATRLAKRIIRPFFMLIRMAYRLPWAMTNCFASRAPRGSNLQVLIAGGYGYANMGDEAQLAENLNLCRRIAPEAQVTVLTPHPERTGKLHGCVTAIAPREAFFDANTRPHYPDSDKQFKKKYFALMPLLLSNAVLLRMRLPTFLLPTKMTDLLKLIARSDLLFLSGGGYLTGRTLSRLWDNMLLVRLAWLLGVPTIMSGQTIGMFNDFFSRRLARWGFKKAKLIYVRDPKDSIEELRSIGITDDRAKCTFDDALFLPSPEKSAVDDVLVAAGLESGKPYAALSIHYWGQSPEQQRKIMKLLAIACDWICDDLGLQIAFVPTDPYDEHAFREVMENMTGSGRRGIVNHGDNPAIAAGCYRLANLCVAMKHHPIIFALGGCVPTVGISLENYYYHKNSGAMRIFGLEDYVVLCDDDRLPQLLMEKIRFAMDNRDAIRRQISDRLEQLRPLRGAVIKRWLDKNS